MIIPESIAVCCTSGAQLELRKYGQHVYIHLNTNLWNTWGIVSCLGKDR